MQRSRRNRVLAGVAGGLGEYAGVDPLVFRVLFAVLTLFGGAGLLLYLVGWLLLPDEGQHFSPAETLVGRGRGGSVAEAALLAACALLLGVLLIRGDATDVALLAIVVVGVLLLLRNVDGRRRPAGSPWPSQPPPYPPPVYPPPPGPGGWPGPAGTTGPAGPAAAWPGAPSLTDPLSTGTATATLPPYRYDFPPPVRPRPRRAPSILGLVALSVALVAVGVLGLLDWTGAADPGARHYFALALAVLGAALLVGAWFGRARWLIAVGVPLTLVLIAVSALQDAARGGVADQYIRVPAAADLATRYETGVGTMHLDLSTVDFTDHRLTTNVHVGLGDVVVLVPRDVDLVVNVHDGLGTLKLLGQHYEGFGQNRRVTDNGPDGVGGGDLELTVDVGLGDVEVDRAPS
jgi:phage shock protein PspC (stress-responsive transcriptional regulator)